VTHMANTDVAYVTPKLLLWARKRRGLRVDKISHSLGVDEGQIEAWEKGSSHPPFNKALQLANILRVPFGFLFLPEPPPIDIPIPDLRTFEDKEAREPSVDFLELLQEVMAKQEWYRDYALEHGAKELPFVGSFTTRAKVVDVATDIRKTLAMNNGFRSKARDKADYLRLFAGSAEDAGILVMRSGVVGNNTHRPLSCNEFQGFAITDRIAPLVFVNARDYKSAQIFTLAHEIAHIWIGKSGISKADETEIPVPRGNVESFSNAVAAETLVPRGEFLRLWREPVDDRLIQRLSRHFFVSTLVILRRARELDQISVGRFITLLEQERNKLLNQPTKAGGGDYYRNVTARHGNKLTEAVLQDVRQGSTGYRDAARLLDMKVPALEKLVERH
jgi:Zn-dependent peptidase ImmA (M78 family)/transcriptional regulator with XRE-family HTH domain